MNLNLYTLLAGRTKLQSLMDSGKGATDIVDQMEKWFDLQIFQAKKTLRENEEREA